MVEMEERPPLPPRGPPLNLQHRQPQHLQHPHHFYPASSDGHGAYSVLPAPKPVPASCPPYRMPPHPLPPLPGTVTERFHTHSNKFPIERQVIVSSSEKNNKIPILSEYSNKRPRSVLPEGPQAQQAWPHQESRDSDKTKISKTYYTIKDIISNKFSRPKEHLHDSHHTMNNHQGGDSLATSLQVMSLATRPQGRPTPPLPILKPNFSPSTELLSPVLPSTSMQQPRRDYTDAVTESPSSPLSAQQQQRRMQQAHSDSNGVYATARAYVVQARPPAQRRFVRPGGPSELLSHSSPNLTANLESNGVYISKTPGRPGSESDDDGGFKTRNVMETSSPVSAPANQDSPAEIVAPPTEKVSSATSSDYEKTTRGSSVGDSGRGSAGCSTGRPGSADKPALLPLELNQRGKEWVDMVESELRQILEPAALQGGCSSTLSDSVSSLTPPLPPLSPGGGSSPTPTPRHPRFKHSTKSELERDERKYAMSKSQRSAGVRREWCREKSRSASKSSIGLLSMETDLGSTTTGPLDSVMDSRLSPSSDEDRSTAIDATDAIAIRRQLQGLEHMYSEVLKLLGARRNGPRHQASRRYGSMSSLPSSVSSRPVRDKRRDDRKKVRDVKGINKRFQRLESHVVTLARSVAHLSSEMRTQHLVIQEMETIRGELAELRSQVGGRSLSVPRALTSLLTSPAGESRDPAALTNPARVKKLTKFFGDEPPLLRIFLKKLGYEKYATTFEAEKIGMVELPYLTEERLQKMGIPLGPRLRILQEAQISFCRDSVYVV